uniref:Methyltransferase domain-containing protein n=1 Tax=Phenylobacterium glaciei TaxID=2803784 RepID=A0A974P4Y8_9CAUL|nr:methyltransferase domain-containing protein [Phenylobacterium glaciei]
MVTDEADAVAYVLSRLPATYAAGAFVLAEAQRMAPDFAPKRLLDAGAGPGGASWAALETWSGIEAATLLDSSRPLLDMAAKLAAEGGQALQNANFLRGDLTAPATDWPQADLVTASYALAEIAAAQQARTVQALWAATDGMLALIEPGTPDGYRRILTARETLLAAGAEILAPCPHALACPLVAPDWCHFVQRLPRSRDHRLAKAPTCPSRTRSSATSWPSGPASWPSPALPASWPRPAWPSPPSPSSSARPPGPPSWPTCRAVTRPPTPGRAGSTGATPFPRATAM